MYIYIYIYTYVGVCERVCVACVCGLWACVCVCVCVCIDKIQIQAYYSNTYVDTYLFISTGERRVVADRRAPRGAGGRAFGAQRVRRGCTHARTHTHTCGEMQIRAARCPRPAGSGGNGTRGSPDGV